MLAALISIAAVVALGAGRAGPGARISRPASGPVAPALAPASELSGIGCGSFGQVAASLYRDEGNGILQIKGRRRNGNGLTLQSSQGPSATLIRSGNTQHAVAEDPMIGATIMMSFEPDT